MSAKLMGLVFELDMTGEQQSVLLALADHASDEGATVYPSVGYLAWKICRSERTVQRILRSLEDVGLIEVVGNETGGRGHARDYRLHLSKGVKKTPFRDAKGRQTVTHSSPQRVTSTTVKGDIHDTERVTPMSPQPLGEPSENQREATAELSVAERRVIARIKQIRGMASVSDVEIAAHLRDILSDRPTPVSDQVLIEDALRFRDFTNERRRTQPEAERWRGWKNGMTNWFTRTRPEPATVSGNGNGHYHDDDNDPVLDSLLRTGKYINAG